MKRLTAVLLVLCMLVLPAAAVPYTDTELEEYMQAIYCEQIWALDYPEFYVQFIDVDLDGRLELLSVEAGEEDAPKQAHVYAFMDAELSHRGYLTIGTLDACRDPKTGESFMVNVVEQDGKRVVQRLGYDPYEMLVTVDDLSAKVAGRLESYGYDPVRVTKAQWANIRVYEDCHAIFFPAYQHNLYPNGTPPQNDTPDPDLERTFSATTLWIVIGAVVVAAIPATALLLRRRRAANY